MTIRTGLWRDLAIEPRTNVPAGIISMALRIARAFSTMRSRRRAILAMHALDDHLLADIGIKRSEIESAARYGRQIRPEDNL